MRHCPPIEVLEQLPGAAAPDQALLAHVAACARCGRRLARLRADAALLETLRRCHPVAGASATGTPHPSESTPPVLPGYSGLEELHRGGQGTVYRARQESTGRMVAIKVLRQAAFAGAAGRERFEREVRILGQLRHPHIVTVFDRGQTEGCFYFVMDYIPGLPLDEFVAALAARPPGVGGAPQSRIVVRRIVRLFADICFAVDAAHQRGIVHRDLKPSNIRIDPDGQPHVLDFGLARDAAEEHAAQMTLTGQFIGSLPWATPEQAAGSPAGINLRTDVYALGVLLFQMLTGRFPYDVTGSLAEVLQRIVHTEPPRPSAVVAAGGAVRRGWRPRRAARHALDDELDTIVHRCLQKDPGRRYATAGELGRDLEAYLAGRPIAAKRDSTWYLLRKSLHRHRLAAGVAGVALCILPAFTVALSILYRDARAAEAEARQRSVELAVLLAESNIREGRLMGSAGSVALAERLLWHEFLTHARDSEVGRLAFWGLWELYSEHPCLASLCTADNSPARIRFIAENEELVAFTNAGGHERWHLPDLQRRARVAYGGAPNILAALSPNGTLALRVYQGQLQFIELRRAGVVRQFPAERVILSAFSPDDRWAAVGTLRGECHLYSLPGCVAVRTLAADRGALRGLCFTSDGTRVVTVGNDRMLRIWNVVTGALLRESDVAAYVTRDADWVALALSPDDRGLALSYGGAVHLFDFAALQHMASRVGGVGSSGHVEFRRDGAVLAATGNEDNRVLVWDLARSAPPTTLLGHTGTIADLEFDGTDALLASSGSDGTIRLWELGGPGIAMRVTHDDTIADTAFHPHGTELVWAAADGRVCAYDIAAGTAIRTYADDGRGIRCLTLSRDGALLAVADEEGRVRVWDYGSATLRCTLTAWQHGAVPAWPMDRHPAPHQVNRVDFDPHAPRLACAGEDGHVTIWDLETATCVRVLAGHEARVAAVAYAPDGRVLASISRDEQVILWNPDTGAVRQSLRAHPTGGRTLAFSSDGRLLATGGDDAQIRVWDVATGACLHTLEGHQQDVFSVAFSPDGRLLASGERSTIDERGRFGVLLWDVAGGRNLAKLRRHSNHVLAVAFAPDSRRLASCGSDHSLLVHDLQHFERHIAGNLEYALQRDRTVNRDATSVTELRRWASEVLAAAAARVN